ncbi:MAG TPA: hypothetical protein VFI24_00050 [Pyrinomonadaceae bacterium]|nr:hypothetical protein [Pyrinomonadaceae bacterium]
MTRIEILAYSPLKMDDFIKYAVDGLKGEDGKYLKDEYDRDITGVFNWLHGRKVPEAHFFNSDLGNPVQMFMALIQPTEQIVVPWMVRIPFFVNMIRTDGLIGNAPNFGAAPKPGTPTALGWVHDRPDLDDIYNQRRDMIASIDYSKLSFTAEEFSIALQGEGRTPLDVMTTEIKERLNLILK